MGKKENIYLAYLEEKCHIHPTLPVRFDLEADYNLGTSRISCVVGGFDCGICFTDSDILQWLIEKDIKPSELEEYIKKDNQKIENGINDIKKQIHGTKVEILKEIQ